MAIAQITIRARRVRGMSVNDTRSNRTLLMQASITFDVDGLQRDPFAAEPTAAQRSALHDLAHDVVLPRIASWLRTVGVKATFFSIGQDVARSPQIYAALAGEGHEIANHTLSHPREFSRLGRDAAIAEIVETHRIIERVTGVAPSGFRSPGYTLSPITIEALTTCGYAYDASLMPSWSYTALKQAFRWLGGARYRNYLVPQSFHCMVAPHLPYPVDATDIYRPSSSASLMEIPITTLGWLEFPFIHATTSRLPAALRRAAIASALRRPFFTLSFHDLEFADRRDFGSLPASGMTEPHLATPIEQRLDELSDVVRRSAATHRFVTMRESLSQVDEMAPALDTP
jgi:peptidoglycan/xylan/chitin deacetylase (PgdA/CDA1 family)